MTLTTNPSQSSSIYSVLVLYLTSTRSTIVIEADGGDEVVAQARKAEDLRAAINTDVHRPPHRVVTQRHGATHGNLAAGKPLHGVGAQPIQVPFAFNEAAVPEVGLISVNVEVRQNQTKIDVTVDAAQCHRQDSLDIRRRPSQHNVGVERLLTGFGGDRVVFREGDAHRASVGLKTSLGTTTMLLCKRTVIEKKERINHEPSVRFMKHATSCK